MNLRFVRSYPYTRSEVLLQLRLEGHFEQFGFDMQQRTWVVFRAVSSQLDRDMFIFRFVS